MIPPNCYDNEFALWAFGEMWNRFNDPMDNFDQPIDLMAAWNARHGSKLMLSEESEIIEDMIVMKAIWANETKKS